MSLSTSGPSFGKDGQNAASLGGDTLASPSAAFDDSLPGVSSHWGSSRVRHSGCQQECVYNGPATVGEEGIRQVLKPAGVACFQDSHSVLDTSDVGQPSLDQPSDCVVAQFASGKNAIAAEVPAKSNIVPVVPEVSIGPLNRNTPRGAEGAGKMVQMPDIQLCHDHPVVWNFMIEGSGGSVREPGVW